jgi:hypothetical protein
LMVATNQKQTTEIENNILEKWRNPNNSKSAQLLTIQPFIYTIAMISTFQFSMHILIQKNPSTYIYNIAI